MRREEIFKPTRESSIFFERGGDTHSSNRSFINALDDAVLTDFLESTYHRIFIMCEFDRASIREIFSFSRESELEKREGDISEDKEYEPSNHDGEFNLSTILVITISSESPPPANDNLTDSSNRADKTNNDNHDE
jgi:hypothetical protein